MEYVKEFIEMSEKNLSEKLKEAYETKDLVGEAKYLEEMGHIYLEKGEKLHDGMDYVKAAALFNAALARCKKLINSDGKTIKECPKNFNPFEAIEKLKEYIIKTEKVFIFQEIKKEKLPGLEKLDESGEMYNKIYQDRRTNIEALRKRCFKELENIEQNYPAYEKENLAPNDKTALEKKRLEAIRALCENISEEMRNITKNLFSECLQIVGRAPCEYALMALGSLATDTITPYSDLELAILLEEGKDSCENKEYFRKCVYLMYIRVVNYGETILPTVQIKSLNWFEDFVTPRGFSFDGQVPWASKTPLGRRATASKPAVELIQTPLKMASLHWEQVTRESVGYDLNYALLNVTLVEGNEKLVTDYRKNFGKILDSRPPRKLEFFKFPTVRKMLFFERLLSISKKFKPNDPFDEDKVIFDVKKELYRLPTILTTAFCLNYNVHENNPWKILENMKNKGFIKEVNMIHLMTAISIVTELRLKQYLTYGKQKETTTSLHQLSGNVSGKENEMIRHDKISMLARYYATIIPLRECLSEYALNLVESSETVNIFPDIFWNKTLYVEGKYNEIKAQLSYNFTDYNQSAKLLENQILQSENRESFDLASLWVKLAETYNSQGKYSEAIECGKQALQIKKQEYGENSAHPSILTLLGRSNDELGRHKEAMEYFEKGLQMQRKIYGENTAHPSIAISLNNLGLCLEHEGNYVQAKIYHERSLQMLRKIYGGKSEHGDLVKIVKSINNLALCFQHLRIYDKAMKLFEEALSVLRQIYGENSAHPYIARILDNLGRAFVGLRKYKDSIIYHEQSLQMLKKIYGEKEAHPYIAFCLNNLGDVFYRLSEFKKALNFHEQALVMRKQIYGENTVHPLTACTLRNIAVVFSTMARLKKYSEKASEAVPFFEKALQMYREVYGHKSTHLEIGIMLKDMSHNYILLGSYEKAIIYSQQALHILRHNFIQLDRPIDVGQHIKSSNNTFARGIAKLFLKMRIISLKQPRYNMAQQGNRNQHGKRNRRGKRSQRGKRNPKGKRN